MNIFGGLFGHNWKGCHCQRCGIHKSHEWNNWNYKNSNSCQQVRHCKNCGEKESRLEHVLGQWIENSTSRHRVCSQCAYEERQTFLICSDCKGTGVCPRCQVLIMMAIGVVTFVAVTEIADIVMVSVVIGINPKK